jgi:amino acid adenylation domain-containing protein
MAARDDGRDAEISSTIEAKCCSVDLENGHPPADMNKKYPLSYAQQRLWTLHLLEPENHAYNICAAFRVHGTLNMDLVKRAVQLLVARHEALRTVFRTGCAATYAEILPEANPELRTVDLSGLPANEHMSRIEQMAQQVARSPVSLSSFPLFSLTLARLGPEDSILLLSAHHMIADDWSRTVFLSELALVYDTLARDVALSLPPSEGRYVDFARRQVRAPAKKRLHELEDYWRNTLSGDLSPLQLPTFRTRPAVASHNGELLEFNVDPNLASSLRSLSEAQGVSLQATVLSAFKVLLYRYTGRRDICVGTAFSAGRSADMEQVIGNFVNTVPVCTELNGETPFIELLQKVQAKIEGARAHMDLPFERIVEVVKPQRDPSSHPVFQAMFVMPERPLTEIRQSGLTFSPVQVHNGTSKFDMTWNVWEDGDVLKGSVEYASELFDRDAIERMMQHYRILLSGVAEDTSIAVQSLPLLGEAECQKMTFEWNDTERTYDHSKCIHELFEEAVVRLPDAVAAEFADQKLSYGELNKRANRLAHLLREDGVSPGVPVAIALERSLDMPVALLGILKSGGYYVPLDPSWPIARTIQVLSSLQTRHLVTHRRLLGMVGRVQETYKELDCVVSLDGTSEETASRRSDFASSGRLRTGLDLERQSGENPNPAADPEDIAYVIFTSGSTGVPKGVVVKHKPVINLIEWVNKTFNISSSDRLLSVASLCFDLSVYDIFGILAAGGRVVVASSPDIHDPARLIRLTCDRGITFWDSAPALLQQLAPFLRANVPEGQNCALRLVFLSGDWIPLTLPDAVRAAFPKARVIGLGGATEATVWSNFYPIDAIQPHWKSIPYGRPIQNARYYVLDGQLSPFPIGVAGDLYIGGECLASGYANDPERTRERFIQDPFSRNPNAVMYKTGDLARFMPDGNIEFLGRSDHQVKIRGFRIELGEIENALTKHSSVRDAVVTARGPSKTEKELVAYVTLKQGAQAGITALRQHLQDMIPEYMIPASWVFMERIPLTANGKVDMKALPDPARERPELEQTFVAPRDKLETTVRDIWCEVLGLESVGVKDRFFDLGGTSLKAVQVVAKINERLGSKIPALALFEAPTIEQFVHKLKRDYEETIARANIDEPVTQDAYDNATPEDSSDSTRKCPAVKSMKAARSATTERAIAIVGMAARFPGAEDIEQFWKNLRDGVESFTKLSEQDLLQSGVDPVLFRNPDYVRVCATIENVESFDAGFFGITPREAELMDPQHRVFLECAWAALEDAACDPYSDRGLIGIFGGVARNAYFANNIATHPNLLKDAAQYTLILGYDKDYATTRVSYKLNLRGPSIAVQTACSSSGVALHLACESLERGESDIALVGGCRIIVPSKAGYLYVDGGTLSPDGHLRAFDKDAKGMVRGSGVGFVALKRLEDALRDGDTIRAVVRGSAINNDGSDKIGYTAPSISGQAAAIAAAIQRAGISAGDLSYIETHGTATALGDPIEIAALTKAFRETTNKRGYCYIGSVKTNIGHLDAGACVAGIIKTVLALEHGEIPPSLNYSKPNPEIDFQSSPFIVNDRLRPWLSGSSPRRAGVSSLGLGGTNVHIVLEEAPPRLPAAPFRPYQLLVLSAKSAAALNAASANLSEYLAIHHDVCLADVAYTLQTGRALFEYRRFAVCRDAAEAAAALKSQDGQHSDSSGATAKAPEVAFMFPGQGSQHVNMARDLYEAEPIFREIVDRCCRILRPDLGIDLLDVIYPVSGHEKEASRRLEQTKIAQPAIFVIEYALAWLWMRWGVNPSAMIGHSIGEYAAACVAGVFSLKDALRIVAIRARLMQAVPSGSMCAVNMSEEQLTPYLGNGVTLAASNSPSTCVFSGPTPAVAELARRLKQQGAGVVELHTSHAFHSSMMDPILTPFKAEVSQHPLSPPTIPFVSGITGTLITAEDAVDPAYWARQLREPVRFSAGLAAFRERKNLALLEVGPSTALASNARKQPITDWNPVIISSLPHANEARSSLQSLLTALGKTWIAGVPVSWRAFHGDQRRRHLPLPTYPFERKRYWIEPPVHIAVSPQAEGGAQPITTSAEAHPLGGQAIQETHPAAAVPVPFPVKEATRKERIIDRLRTVMVDISGVEFGEGDGDSTFLEMGLDSLLLTQVASSLQDAFGVPIRFRQLLESLITLNSLAEYLDKELPPSGLPRETPVASAVTAPPASAPRGGNTFQLSAGFAAQEPGSLEQDFPQQPQDIFSGEFADAPGRSSTAAPASGVQKAFGAGAQIDKTRDQRLTPEQQARLVTFIAEYTARTRRSKEYTQRHRAHFADPRTVTGFSPQLKELAYPIVIERSRGSRMWDIDGNEYIDVTGCFGANLLGFSPPFIMRAIRRQLKAGIEIGPQHGLAGPAAKLVSEITGFERVVFCNTGSEAVQGAMRLVRTVSGRNLIVTFMHSYHGNFDEVIVRGAKKHRSIPAAPGIPPQSVENILVLEYGAEESLRIIRERASELAAVMVEPVQTRDLNHQPREFLHQIRDLTRQLGIALVFDELVTGFRAELGGAQAHFGVRADVATYGKIIAGGMPIGAIAGIPKYMDALDGGFWRYGDDSIPETGVTYFAGTFVRHPLAMAASVASLKYLKQKGPQLQKNLNKTMDQFATELQQYFVQVKAPMTMKYFGSSCRFYFDTDSPYHSLFYPWLRYKGIHIYDSRTWFLNTAHTARDMARISKAIKETVTEMMAASFIAPVQKASLAAESKTSPRALIVYGTEPPQSGARLGRDPHGDPGWYVEDPRTTARHLQVGSSITFEEAKLLDVRDRVPVEYDPFARGELRLVVPATESQREIWLTAKMNSGGNCAFNESVSVRLKGRLDLEHLRASIAEGIQRHEAMRTTFSSDGAALCVVSRIEIEIPFVDLSALEEGERRAKMDGILREEVVVPFNLEFGPLVRAKIVKLAEEDHQVVITSHHIVCDGWSIDVVVKDIGAIYSAKTNGLPPDLKEPERFSWYAVHMAERAVSREHRASEDYWLQVFSSDIPVLDLPLDKPRPPHRTFEAQRLDLPLDPSLQEGIKKIASQTGCTFVTVVMAAFNVLIHRLTGQDDVVVGLPAAGQSMVGKDLLVGHCVNLLPLRSRSIRTQRFSDYVKSYRSVMLDAYEHQEITFGRLLKRLSLKRDPSRIPLVSAIFNIDMGIDLGGMKFEGLDVDFYANPRAYENFELFLNVSPAKGGRFMLELTHNSNLFAPQTAGRWLKEFDRLLMAIVADPHQALGEIDLLTADERSDLVLHWNPPAVEYPRSKPVHKMFEEQADLRPDALAVTCGNERLTYRQLKQRAGVISSYLESVGVHRGDTVGVFLERSADMVASLLGILRSGAAYLPLDPAFPTSRLEAMMEDAGCEAVVSQRALSDRIPGSPPRIIVLEDINLNTDSPASSRIDGAVDPGDLAYLIYTSGSTGKPKGVEIRHGSLVNFLHSMMKEPGLSSNDVLLAVTTLSFDIAGLEIFLPLVSGARVALASREAIADGKQLLQALQQSGATVMQATPATWRILLEAGWSDGKGFRALCGGEALSRELANAIVHTGAELWNLYGPTETTIWSAISRVERREEPPFLGHPIANTQFYVLDGFLKPSPLGVPGELFIAGDGLARGYHANRELTDEKFIPDPFGPRPDGRMYKTGDLVRRLADGSLEFLGRLDDQVKLRGYRIELGDIESHLDTYPSIKQSVAIVREDIPGHKRLVAYYVPEGTSRIDPDDLSRHLQGALPSYMVPSIFVPMDQFPLTPNGKVNRKSLPKPETDDVAAQPAYVAPRNDTEADLVRMWERLLDIRPISVNASFFDLGGDSLTAARFFADLERRRGRAIPLSTLFESPTIESLARVLDAGGSGITWSSLVPVQAAGTRPPLFLVHGAEGNILLYKELASSLGRDQPVYGLQAQGLDGQSDPLDSIEGMASRYLQEIIRACPEGPYLLGGYCMGGAVALEIAQRLLRTGKQVRLVAMIETYNVHETEGRKSFYRDTLNRLENLVYHVLNVMFAGRTGNRAFLRQKYMVAKRRFRARISMAWAALAGMFGFRKRVVYHHVRIDRIDDIAHENYAPGPYAGSITLFRPKVHYTGYGDALFGWGEVALKGVDVHRLRVFPRGMLVQPYVKQLAEELRTCIDISMRDKSEEES